MRRLSIREWIICLVCGGLLGWNVRPHHATTYRGNFIPDSERLPALLCVIGGAAVILGLYRLLTWRMKW